MTLRVLAAAAAAGIIAIVPRAVAQQPHDHAGAKGSAEHDSASNANSSPAERAQTHEMWMRSIGGGWMVSGMAQAIPTLTGDDPLGPTSAPQMWEAYLTQPVIMGNLMSPGARLALRVTLNFEGLTQRDGEITYGAWGEGFIDSRHPHTLLHELMLSANVWRTPAGSFSLSAGKGFAPYGTDDPMSRPALKYPTNHHLSQVLERWTLNAQYLARGGTSIEGGIFGGAEPTGPYDSGNIDSFGDSWSVRVGQRFGAGFGSSAPWEVSLSYANVQHGKHDAVPETQLANVALRYEQSHDFGNVYALAEASRSWPDSGDGYFSILAEARVAVGPHARHKPYYRVELATRPEYQREGIAGTDGFFRYDHDAAAIGATRWLINTFGYAYEASDLPFSVQPYAEFQHNSVHGERGRADPYSLYGSAGFWSLSFGLRFFIGGAPMRMGSYGLLDPMAAAMRPGQSPSSESMSHEGMMHERR
jgi:hypothetical protein